MADSITVIPTQPAGQGTHHMSRHGKLLQRVLDGRSDTSIRFDDLRGLLRNLGFTERVRGSHHIFRKDGVAEKLNLQRDDGHAKSYQVRQVRGVVQRYNLRGQSE